MGGQKIVVLIGLLSIMSVCVWWHIRENRALKKQLDDLVDVNSAQWLVHFAWSRTIQLVSVFTCGILVLIGYDLQLNELRSELHSNMETMKEVVAQSESAHRKQLEKVTKADPLETTPPPPIRNNNQPVFDNAVQHIPTSLPTSIPPISGTTSIPLAKAAITENLSNKTTPPAEPSDITLAKNTVEDVYNPEKNKTDAQSNMDEIKKRYEDIFVIYMFLKKCGKVQQSDYNTITSALAQEMASVNAPGRMQYDVVSAAKGSYKEIYAESPCNGKGIDSLHVQYNDYIKLLAANFPSQ